MRNKVVNLAHKKTDEGKEFQNLDLHKLLKSVVVCVSQCSSVRCLSFITPDSHGYPILILRVIQVVGCRSIFKRGFEKI